TVKESRVFRPGGPRAALAWNVRGTSQSAPAAGYLYRAVDRSVLLPYLTAYYLPLFYRWVPRSMTANQITLASSGCMWLMVCLLEGGVTQSSWAIALSFCFLLHAYVVGDYLD